MAQACKFCRNPKTLALATWSLLANNPINQQIYLLFSAIDFLFLVFFALSLLANIHYLNCDPHANEESPSACQSSGLSLLIFRRVHNELANSKGSPYYWFQATIACFAFELILLICLIANALVIKTHFELGKSNNLRKILAFVLVSMITFLSLPLLEIILMCFADQPSLEEGLPIVVITNLVGAGALICYILLTVYSIRTFNICIPTTTVPWCTPLSKLIYSNQVIRVLLVAFYVFDIDGNNALAEVLVLFFVLLGQCFYRLMFIPSFNKQVDFLNKARDIAVVQLLFLGLLCQLVNDTLNYDLVYFIIIYPFLVFVYIAYETQRKQQILVKLKTNTLKMGMEYEYALYIIMDLVKDSVDQKQNSAHAMGQLLDLVQSHIQTCSDDFCMCRQIQGYYDLMQLGQEQNQEVFSLLPEENERFAKIIGGQNMVSTISPVTDYLSKKATSNNQLNENEPNNDCDSSVRNFRSTIREEDQLIGVSPSNRQKRKRSALVRVRIDEVKYKFLSEILSIFVFNIQRKFPNSLRIQLVACYFHLYYKQSEMLSTYYLSGFNKRKLSYLEKQAVMVNEQYLLNQINMIVDTKIHGQAIDANYKNSDGQYFIKVNQLTQQFDLSIEKLSTNVIHYWNSFGQSTLDVDNSERLGGDIAEEVTKTYNLFNEMDRIKKSRDHQIYFQFALVQLNLLNDPLGFELYLGKMKSIIEMNKVYQKNYSGQSDANGNTTFMVVNGNGARFGQILQMNKKLRDIVGWAEDDIKRYGIENLMPTMIREKHPAFLKRYSKTGQSFVLNNNVTIFIKKKDRYIVPVEVFIKFHYSIDYEYTFIGIIKPFQEVSPFTNRIPYQTDELIFIICDDEEGHIREFSDSCKKFFNFYEHLDNGNKISIKIDDILQGFNFKQMKAHRQERQASNVIYEQIHQFNQTALAEYSQSVSKERLTQKQETAMLPQIQRMLTRVFEESYSSNILRMNIFCFLPIIQTSNGSLTKLRDLESQLQADYRQVSDETVEEEEVSFNSSVGERMAESVSSATGSSSQNSNSSDTNQLRNFHAFQKQDTPKTLKIIVQLMIALYLIITAISTLNLGLNLVRQAQSEADVKLVKVSYEIMNAVTMNTLYIRVLLNIASGYEPDDSAILNDRFDHYKKFQADKIEELQDAWKVVQQAEFEYSKEFSDFKSQEIVNLQSLNQQNVVQYQNQTINVAMNLFIQRLLEFNNLERSQMTGNLFLQGLNPNRTVGYEPTDLENLIYFVHLNGNHAMRYFTLQLAQRYAEESQEHAKQNITTTLMTAIISIVTIFLVGLIIAPMMTRTEMRKSNALLFFLKIPKPIIKQMIQRCEECLNFSDEKKYFQIQKEYEKLLRVKLVDSHVEQQFKKTTDQEMRQDLFASQSLVRRPGTFSANQSQVNSSIGERIGSSVQPSEQQISPCRNINQDGPQGDLEEENKGGNAQNDPDGSSRNLNKRPSQVNSEQPEIIEQFTQQQNEMQEEQEVKKKKILQRSKTRRSKMVLISITLILGFCSYFVIAFFIGNYTFEAASASIPSLATVFYRGSCLDQASTFMRLNQIRNESVLVTEGNVTGSTYYVERCKGREEEYSRIRQKLPNYFEKAKSNIEQLESSNFCDFVYDAQQQGMNENCVEAINGILTTGISNAFLYMLYNINRANIRFMNAGETGVRDTEFLEAQIRDETIIQILDTKASLLDPALEILNESCLESAISYIEQQLRDFIIVYLIFIVLLTAFVGLALLQGFKKIRMQMWNTNKLLRILPIEELTKEDKSKIREFFNA